MGIRIGADTGGTHTDLVVVDDDMANAIKLISVQRGLDPRDFALVGFGGAGPLHALRLADELGITTALIPPAPGNLSALGMLTAQVRHDLVRTRLGLLDAIDPAALAADFDELLEQGRLALAGEELVAGETRFIMTVDLRYRGQNYELNLKLPAGDMAAALAALPERFHARHQTIFGYANPGKPVGLVNLRLAATGATPSLPWPTIPAAGAAAPAPVERRRVQIDAATAADIPVFRLSDMKADHVFAEPAIVEYPGSTLFVPPGWSARCDQYQILHLTRVVKESAR